MGLIILPILIGAIIIWVVSLIQLIKLKRNKSIDLKTTIFGILITILIYCGIGLSYSLEESVWGLSPYFRIPFWMFYIPGLGGLILMQINNMMIKNLAKSIIVSVVFSGIVCLILHNYVFGIVDLLNIEKDY